MSKRRNRPGHEDPNDDLDLERRASSPRRKGERIELRIWTEGSSPDGAFTYRTCTNLSEGGIFLESVDPPAPGSRMVLEFRLPGHNSPIRVACQVASSLDAETAMENLMGFGLRFLDLAPSDKERIRNYVAQTLAAV